MTTLLVDEDIVAYRAASVSQEVIDWDSRAEGQTTVEMNEQGAEDYMVAALKKYAKVLDADKIIVCLSDERNFRKELWAEYKANRKDIARPLLLEHCKRFLAERYRVERWSRLEADDVMGILATEIKDSVIVSVDKDLKNVPCRLWNPDKPERGVIKIDADRALMNHLQQTLVGDASDGYKGCPGVGVKKAEKIVGSAMYDFMHDRNRLWNAVKNTYEARGQTEATALLNARLSYILNRPGDYDRTTAKVRLWRP